MKFAGPSLLGSVATKYKITSGKFFGPGGHPPWTNSNPGSLLGVGALKQLDGRHGELKSMHTTEVARGRGIGRAMVDHLIGVARDRGFRRVSLETGSMAAFAPAQSLVASAGFRPCGPFGDYRPSRNSILMTLPLDGPVAS